MFVLHYSPFIEFCSKVEATKYCDFCLGDASHNKKTGDGPEELIGLMIRMVQPKK